MVSEARVKVIETVLQALCVSAITVIVGLWVQAGSLGARYQNPLFPFHYYTGVAVFTQLLLSLRYFLHRASLLEAIGFSTSGTVSWLALYELFFKVGFPLADPSEPGRWRWLATQDLLPALGFLFASAAYAGTRRFWSPRSAVFLANIVIASVLWALWILTSYPLRLEAYLAEPDAFPVTTTMNLLTKLSFAALPLTILSRSNR